MDCARAEELLSDHLEGVLASPLRLDLEDHLRECPACQGLAGALEEVVAALRSYPALDPPSGLAERAAAAALRRPALKSGRPGLPSSLHAAAALMAIAITGAVLLGGRSEGPRRTAGSPCSTPRTIGLTSWSGRSASSRASGS